MNKRPPAHRPRGRAMPLNHRLLFTILAVFALVPLTTHAQATASLVAADSSIQPGRPFTVALRLEHEPSWHTYWINPGIGMATTLSWELPAGWSASQIHWPTPTMIRGEEGAITGHGYDGIAYLPVTITPVRDARVGEEALIEVNAQWLMCAEICIPGEGRASVELPISSDAPQPNTAVAAELARLPMPQKPTGWRVSASRDEKQITLKILGVALRSPHFFGEEEEFIEFAAPQTVREEGGGYTFVLPIMDDAPTHPTRLIGVLAYTDAAGVYRGARVDVPFTTAPKAAGTANAEASTPPPSTPSNGAAPNNIAPNAAPTDTAVRGADPSPPSSVAGAALVPAPAQTSFLATLLLAVLGGLILNLMPCVFPVLGIKILGFVNQAGSDRARITRHGLVFTLGVLLSFWALAGLLGVLRAGGAGLGWGFQLQSPAFVFALTIIMLIFALNLSGVFEFGLTATGIGGRLQMKSGYLGSFFSGVLATVVATPCSAPFLAPALGAALALPMIESFFVFTAIGVGLALPYLLLSAFPQAVSRLPRPGRWMETFKQAMAFPLYATAAYLVWVLAGQTTEDAFLMSLLGLTVVAMGVWLYGRYNALGSGARRAAFARTASILLLALGGYWGWPQAHAAEVVWEPWSVERVVELRAEGRPIYVDFTARWCATCQANKKVVFTSDVVLRTFAQTRVATLKADWTNQDARITAELARWNRSAVPFNLIYRPGETQPLVLPSLLTPDIVLEALSP